MSRNREESGPSQLGARVYRAPSRKRLTLILSAVLNIGIALLSVRLTGSSGVFGALVGLTAALMFGCVGLASLLMLRARVTATAQGLIVRNLILSRFIAWTSIAGVEATFMGTVLRLIDGGKVHALATAQQNPALVSARSVEQSDALAQELVDLVKQRAGIASA